jgi:hypothetical protein
LKIIGIEFGDFPLLLGLVLVKLHRFLVQDVLDDISTDLIVGIEGI